jgi:hypothetical protein
MLDHRQLLRNVNIQIEDIFRELDVQMKRLAQIQQQVDDLRAKSSSSSRSQTHYHDFRNPAAPALLA